MARDHVWPPLDEATLRRAHRLAAADTDAPGQRESRGDRASRERGPRRDDRARVEPGGPVAAPRPGPRTDAATPKHAPPPPPRYEQCMGCGSPLPRERQWTCGPACVVLWKAKHRGNVREGWGDR
jgi:hypothetical protein